VTKQILVIDDDPAVRLTIVAILAGLPYQVICAADGEEGIRLFRSLRPDLVITDILMPKQEGIETILAIRQEQSDAKVIAMSGGGRIGRTDLLIMARELGADHILAKPFDIDGLTAVVQQILSE
jgi:two-component system, chemotaxis family, chemotaxis protein CheY